MATPLAKLSWGILGTGSIARTFAKGLGESRTGVLNAVASRTLESAAKFAEELGLDASRAFGGYEAMLADPQVQAVYIATPHPQHAEWAIKAAIAGKHLLVEKPIAVNLGEAQQIVEAASANDVFLMEAFMYRCHPQTAKLIELIKSKVIGEVKTVLAAFSFHWPRPFDPNSRILKNSAAGGGILDVGCYPVSLARLVAGAAMGTPSANPIDVKGVAHLEPTGVDGYAAAVMKFPGDILAQLSCGVQLEQKDYARIYGTDGNFYLPSPWNPGNGKGEEAVILVQRRDEEPYEVRTQGYASSMYALEADVVAANIVNRQAPEMNWADSLGNMQTLDRWRESVGLRYDFEHS